MADTDNLAKTIAEGTYQVSAGELARKLITHMLSLSHPRVGATSQEKSRVNSLPVLFADAIEKQRVPGRALDKPQVRGAERAEIGKN